MASELIHAAADVSNVMKFENWLRFYFCSGEEGEAVKISIPKETLEDITAKYPDMVNLAEHYDGALIDYQRSCAEVCATVASAYDGTKYPSGLVQKAFDSKELKLEMYIFGLWMHAHEEMLDEETMSFEQWLDHFNAWKNSDEVKDYLTRLTDVDSTQPQ
ncbi:hypothetical protein [Desulfobaculum bizertense]|uniref:Uncharacterized protein n=1 Tax=Desulfobaculum bizertense DSM 18034 TaxID=1121442 RepID=A0A1T4WC58_9BACT|nr:hypothetical protein [Desulfobaculum bizertense]UIJ37431.1 hypothetical protein LWC08_12000 [Desulfobaculum bizertense]SKA74873.1 hypothetical protein SAMN02745702_02058 [Desulfobaculum bizertense DSM 18034]